MTDLVLLEADLRRVFNASQHCDERGIFQFNLQEEDKILEQVVMLEQEKLGVSLRKKAEVEQSPQRGLSEIVRVLVAVLRQADLRYDDIQARGEFDWFKYVRLVRIESRELHWVPRIPQSRFWDDSRSVPSDKENSMLAETVRPHL